jgi:hypothetical protein
LFMCALTVFVSRISRLLFPVIKARTPPAQPRSPLHTFVSHPLF